MEWAQGSKSILEIGSRYGGTLIEFAKDQPERIVSVDLPGYGPWGNSDSEPYLKAAIEMVRHQGIDAHLFLGNSRDPEIVEQVRELGPYDFIFIDGDHTYEGVKTDWENYGGMGKLIAFHDIIQPKAGENQALEVWRFWKELKEHFFIQSATKCEEFMGPDSKMGIGLVR